MSALHRLNLADVLAEHARGRPQSDALVCGDDRHTWPAFDERTNRLANALGDHGVGEGDRVLWLGQNCHRLLEGLLACAKLGAVFAPLNWRQTADELAWVVGDADARAVLWQDEEIGEVVAAARQQAGSNAWGVQHDGDGGDGYEAVLAAAKPEFDDRDVDPASSVLMLYTAAFEGKPNGALLSHSALLHQALATAIVQRITPDYTYLNSGPLFHIATFLTTAATFHLGGKNVFTRRSDAEEMCRLIDAEGCNGAFLLYPTVSKMAEVNADARYDLSSLNTMKMGVEAFDEMVSHVRTPWISKPGGYGQTEVTGLATYSAFGSGGFSTGRSSPVALVRIVDPDGAELPPGETGEIVVRGPVVMNAYHARDEETAGRQRGGWHHTNDLGRREDDGSITFVGPKTKLVKTGAENVYPAEVEACLMRHPAVREVAVIGVSDAEWGQNVKAVVALHPDNEVTADDLIEHCKAQIASYKKPKEVEFVEALPRTQAGMVDRDAVDAAHGGGGYPGEGS